MGNDLIKNEIDEMKKCEEKIKRKDLKYETKKYTYDFQQYPANICWSSTRLENVFKT